MGNVHLRSSRRGFWRIWDYRHPRSGLKLLVVVEEGQRDGVALGDIAGVVDMQMIAAIVGGKDLCGVVGVSDGFVKIDDAVKFTACANPGVDLLTDLLVLG